MIKTVKYILIICPIILSILLTINIYKYISLTKQNKDIIENNSIYEEKVQNLNTEKDTINTELNNLKEKYKDKIWEYDRWIKWNQEIKEKIN